VIISLNSINRLVVVMETECVSREVRTSVLNIISTRPDCWLEVSLHLEGPATGQIDKDFPWFSSVLEQMLSWYPNFTLHCMLHMQPSHWYVKISLLYNPPNVRSNFTVMQAFLHVKKLIPVTCSTSTRRMSGACLLSEQR
jgi:hypothetical protein